MVSTLRRRRLFCVDELEQARKSRVLLPQRMQDGPPGLQRRQQRAMAAAAPVLTPPGTQLTQQRNAALAALQGNRQSG